MLWQDEPLSPSSLPGAGCPTQGSQTAPGASDGTAAPAAPDPYAAPSLPDKAPGVYEVLGPGTVLHRVVELALRTGSNAGELAAQFTELLDVGYSTGLRLNQLTDANSGLAAQMDAARQSIAAALDALGWPPALRDLAAADGIDDEMLRHGVFQRGCLPEDMPVKAYPADFIENLVDKWPQWAAFIKENADIPF